MSKSKRTIATVSAGGGFFLTIIFSPTLLFTALRMFGVIMRDFFFPQSMANIFRKLRPIVSVDHPYDDTIPFSPSYVKKYMSFIPLWMRCSRFLRKVGGKKSKKEIKRLIKGLTDLYRDSGKVYKKAHTTTKRPKPIMQKDFLVIHFFDPHLNCIPSLHVSVASWTTLWLKEALTNLDLLEEYNDQWLYVHKEAMDIIDTIMLVKQHSVNCVSAGLWFMEQVHPSFPEKWSLECMQNLLSSYSGEDLTTRENIRSYTTRLYKHIKSEYKKSDREDYPSFLFEILTSEKGVSNLVEA